MEKEEFILKSVIWLVDGKNSQIISSIKTRKYLNYVNENDKSVGNFVYKNSQIIYIDLTTKTIYICDTHNILKIHNRYSQLYWDRAACRNYVFTVV